MRRRRIVVALALAGAVLAAPTPGLAQKKRAVKPKPKAQKTAPKLIAPVVGDWQGVLDTGAVKLRLMFHIQQRPDGTLVAAMDSVDQGARGIPVSKAEFKGRTLVLELSSLGVRYEGELTPESDRLEGTFTQGVGLPLILSRGIIAPPARPQTPKPPFPYREVQVTFDSMQSGVTLAGTLTLPQGAGPHPAVLLITGSGPQDRDETLFEHKPFKVIADYLTRRGIAVLRFDDRGVGGSTGSFATATSDDFTLDALGGLAYLKGRKEVNAKQIGLMGHSEGGLIAPLAASRTKEVAFVVLLAGPGLPGEDILVSQGERIAKASGAPDAATTFNTEVQRAMFAVVRKEPDNEKAVKALLEVWRQKVAALPADQRKVLEAQNAQMAAQARQITSPWFRHFLSYDPRVALRDVSCPVLALNGEKDLQVPAKENLASIALVLREAGNKDVTTAALPGLNHLFQTAQTGVPAEYAQIEETFSPDALKRVGDWVTAHVTVTAK